MDDAWEKFYFGNLSQASRGSDADHDRYSDLNEYLNWINAIADPAGNGFDPTRVNATGGESYGIGLADNEFWQLVLPAILSAGTAR